MFVKFFAPALLLLFFSPAWAQKEYAQDMKIGSEAAVQIEMYMGVVRLEAAERTIKQTGERLVAGLSFNPYAFSFKIIDQPEPNAFALPGGYIYVSRGLLALLKNEDELAGVLGHEIIHVIQRHAAKSQRKGILPAIFALPGVILGGTLGGDIGDKVAAPFLGAGQVLMASYGRKQETESDNLGIELAARCGYRPVMLASILDRIQKAVDMKTGKTASFSFLSDHPMTPDRTRLIHEKSAKLPVALAASQKSEHEFLSSFDHVIYGPNPVNGIFNSNVFLHPKANIYWSLPEGWSYYNEARSAGATSPNGKDVISLTVAGPDESIDTLIEIFVNRYYSKTRKKPISDKQIKMIGREGSEVILPSDGKDRVLYTNWFKKDSLTYVILAIGSNDIISSFRDISQAFRDLKPADYPLIQYQELKTVLALQDESIPDLNKRTSNALPVEITAMINEVAVSYSYKANEVVKITSQQKYIMKE